MSFLENEEENVFYIPVGFCLQGTLLLRRLQAASCFQQFLVCGWVFFNFSHTCSSIEEARTVQHFPNVLRSAKISRKTVFFCIPEIHVDYARFQQPWDIHFWCGFFRVHFCCDMCRQHLFPSVNGWVVSKKNFEELGPQMLSWLPFWVFCAKLQLKFQEKTSVPENPWCRNFRDDAGTFGRRATTQKVWILVEAAPAKTRQDSSVFGNAVGKKMASLSCSLWASWVKQSSLKLYDLCIFTAGSAWLCVGRWNGFLYLRCIMVGTSLVLPITTPMHLF